MRTSVGFIVAVPLLLVAPVDGAMAQNYPWCAQYTLPEGGRNCGFVSREQCTATVSGVGGYCEPNAMYRPAELAPGRRRGRRDY